MNLAAFFTILHEYFLLFEVASQHPASRVATTTSGSGAASGGAAGPNPPQSPPERPYFPIAMRLLRVVAVLLTKYNDVLV